MHTDLQRNVVYCLTHVAALHGLAPKRLADVLRVDPSTIARWKNFAVAPSDTGVSTMAKVIGLAWEIFYLPHQEFTEAIAKLDPAITDFSAVEPRVEFGAIEKWRHLWTECHKKHSRSYILYTRVLSNPANVAKSMLRIKDVTTRGISFDIFNVDDRYDHDKPSIYIYDGLVFPIFDCLAFYAEDNSRNEPLFMVSSASQVDTPTVLTGYLAAVAVTPEIRTPRGTRAVLAFRSRRTIEVGNILPTLGIRTREDIKMPLQTLLFENSPVSHGAQSLG